jgi:hypothetical protein
VSWDDPAIQPARIEPFTLDFDSGRQAAMIENWNPFPGGIDASVIEREFEAGWLERAASLAPEGGELAPPSGSTCQWLYKNITMDAGGRIFPCCASPRPDADLVFSKFDGAASELFNSGKYRLSRLFFKDPKAYWLARDPSGLDRDRYCVICEWNKTATNTGSAQIRDYFKYLKTTGGSLFNSKSLEILSSW